MLNIYEALDITQTTLIGGSTQPIILTVGTKNEVEKEDFVVKIFKPKNEEQYKATNKEVYAHILAQEFDIKTPNAAIIYVGNEVIKSINALPNYQDFNLIAGHYFGTQYLDNTQSVSSEILNRNVIEDIAVLENIYAFDVLIRNVDRTKRKPNMLLVDNELYAIDHELSLDIHHSFAHHLETASWIASNHSLLPVLKSRYSNNQFLFAEFEEYLKNLNFSNFDKCVAQLKNECNKDVSDSTMIRKYLLTAKQQHRTFINYVTNHIKQK